VNDFRDDPGGAFGPPAIRSSSRIRLRDGVTPRSTVAAGLSRLQPIWKRWLSSRRKAALEGTDWELEVARCTAVGLLTPRWPVDGWRTCASLGVASGGGDHFAACGCARRRLRVEGLRVSVPA